VGVPGGEPPADLGPLALFIDAAGSVASGPPIAGSMTLAAIEESVYTAGASQARSLSEHACVESDGVTICNIIEFDPGGDVTWGAVAEVASGSADGSAAAQMDANSAGGNAEASTPVENLDSQWVSLTWNSPSIQLGAFDAVLTGVIQIGPEALVSATCHVQNDTTSITYFCLQSSS
jgi:hypothetical protein